MPASVITLQTPVTLWTAHLEAFSRYSSLNTKEDASLAGNLTSSNFNSTFRGHMRGLNLWSDDTLHLAPRSF